MAQASLPKSSSAKAEFSCYPRNQVIEPCAALDIRPILCGRSASASHADGYSRIRRGKRNGVFAAQAGPGIENAFPGVAQAYAENVPLLSFPAGLRWPSNTCARRSAPPRSTNR